MTSKERRTLIDNIAAGLSAVATSLNSPNHANHDAIVTRFVETANKLLNLYGMEADSHFLHTCIARGIAKKKDAKDLDNPGSIYRCSGSAVRSFILKEYLPAHGIDVDSIVEKKAPRKPSTEAMIKALCATTMTPEQIIAILNAGTLKEEYAKIQK